MSRLFYLGLSVLLLAGCASYGVVDNRPDESSSSERTYSTDLVGQQGTGKISLILSFSGGGTRAAALAYGVMLELRDTRVIIDGAERSLLGELDVISSVSGGSFTAAYYGLFGDQLFEDFETVFLRRNVQSELLAALFNPLRWFSSKGRTEIAIDLYQKAVFRNKSYADMRRDDSPLILINASDLFYGVRFSFVQEYFDLLRPRRYRYFLIQSCWRTIRVVKPIPLNWSWQRRPAPRVTQKWSRSCVACVPMQTKTNVDTPISWMVASPTISVYVPSMRSWRSPAV